VLKFNMGCGRNHRSGYINVDSAAASQPDEVVDLEVTPWPWADNCADEVSFIHSLEHLGGDPKVFLAIMSELYRICAPGAHVTIHVPHPRHDFFLNDPTHVRPVTGQMLNLFDREANERWRVAGLSNTPLAVYTGVDFKVIDQRRMAAEPYASQMRSGQLSVEAFDEFARSRNNVIEELQITLLVRKPPAQGAAT
jgi:hypothetical protein